MRLKLRIKPSLFLGPRTIKTGFAATLSVYLCHFIPYSLPLLAGTAAVICVQPSITAGLQKGFTRAKTTIVAGLFGLVLYFIFGTNFFVMGLAVITLIPLFKRLGWEEGIVLASLTVIAIMSDDSYNPFFYILGRVTSTLIGIAIATVTNIFVVRPRHELTFRQELKQLTKNFPELYINAVEAFASSNTELVSRVLQDLKKAEDEIASLNIELNYLKAGSESRYGIYLEGIDLQELVYYEQGVHFLENVLAKIHDIVEVTEKRWLHKTRARLQDERKKRSAEFENLLEAVRELAQKLAQLHKSVFLLVGGKKQSLLPDINRQTDEIKYLKEEVREKLRHWQVEHIQELDIFSLMSTHRVIFDLEEITNGLRKFANACANLTGEEERNKSVKNVRSNSSL